MKRRLILLAALMLGLCVQFTPSANALPRLDECFNEYYGSGTCGLTCVRYNDQGSIDYYKTVLYPC